jgi:hypothetical protein
VRRYIIFCYIDAITLSCNSQMVLLLKFTHIINFDQIFVNFTKFCYSHIFDINASYLPLILTYEHMILSQL